MDNDKNNWAKMLSPYSTIYLRLAEIVECNFVSNKSDTTLELIVRYKTGRDPYIIFDRSIGVENRYKTGESCIDIQLNKKLSGTQERYLADFLTGTLCLINERDAFGWANKADEPLRLFFFQAESIMSLIEKISG